MDELARWRTVLAWTLAIAVCVAGWGCGEAEEEMAPPPSGPFAEALALLGGGGEGAIGVGWVDPRLAAERGVGDRVMAESLGPNAGTLIERAGALHRRYELDVLGADRMLSVGGSYAFGLRLDGVDGSGLARALEADGARATTSGDVELVNAGAYAEVPSLLLDAGVRGLGARDAFANELTVLAISSRARAAFSDAVRDLPTSPLTARPRTAWATS
jgi:hypothetical protein